MYRRKKFDDDEKDIESLIDSNEQEQYKDSRDDLKINDIIDDDEVGEDAFEFSDPSPYEPVDNKDKRSAPSKKKEARLPERVPEPKPPKAKSEKEETYAFRWEYTESKKSKKDKDRKKKEKSKKPKSNVFFPTLVMGTSFLLAFCILCSAILHQKRTDEPTVAPSLSDAPRESEADSRVIYIRDGASSDALTPQEIYSYCSASVVSIKTASDTSEGIGSGFIFSSDGYIATVEHVVADMTNISVILQDGTSYPAELIASNKMCDLALLKIDGKDLPAVEFGDSSSLLIGEEVIAIGTPASVEFFGTMTRGDVSFNNRAVYIYDEDSGALKKKMFLIQTSAALNPGNSGGPIFDAYGRVVGIVTMKLGEGFDGIGFAVPSDPAKKILESMATSTEISDEVLSQIAVNAAKIGIVCKSYSDEKIHGVQITDFASESSDAAKKLRKGDIIVCVNDTPIVSAQSLAEEIMKYNPSDTVRISLVRSSQLLTFDIILE